MAAFRAGKNSAVSVGGILLLESKWDATHRGDDLDTTNFEGNGNESGLIGVAGLDWSFGANWDFSKNPYTNPPGVYPRDDGSAMKLYADFTNGKFYNLPTWRCLHATTGSTVRGLVTYNASGKAQDDFTYTNVQGNM